VAKKLATTYLPINVIDAIFWVWGLMTLKYTVGDVVRDNIMRESDGKYDANDLDHNYGQGTAGIGTIRR